MFEKILFATTVSPTCDDAAKVAFELSRKNASDLSVCHVYGLPSRGFSTEITDVRTGEREETNGSYHEYVVQEMKDYYEKQLESRTQVSLEALTGIPHTEILRKARKEKTDLIIMGAHTREEDIGATKFRSVVGSTMQRVSRSARCPVLIISRPCVTCWTYFANIVFATDFSKPCDHAFRFAVNVAEEIGAKLHIVHTINIDATDVTKITTQKDIELRIEEARSHIEKRYVANMGEFDNYEVSISEGTPYVELLKYTRERKGDLIIMAHHSRQVDPEEAVLGSTVEQVVLRAACPVISVNHPDYVDLSPYGEQEE